MDSSIVVKVKYGDTLRRFNVRVLDDGLEFNLEGLLNKIRGLFKFSADDDITLTYLDEDDDEVTLGDDGDLSDVVGQGLNPLRISVSSSTGRSARTPRNSGSPTPLRSPQMQQPFQDFNSVGLDFFKSVPEPLLRTVSKILTEFASTGTSSGPSFVEVVQRLAETGLPYLRQPSVSDAPSNAVTHVSAHNAESALSSSAAQGADSSNVQKSEPKVPYIEKFENLTIKSVKVNPEAVSKSQPTAKTSAAPTSQAGSVSEVTGSDEAVNFGIATERSKEPGARFPGLESVKAALESVNSEGNGFGGVAPPNISSALKEKAILDEYTSLGKSTQSPFLVPPNISNPIPLTREDNPQPWSVPPASNPSNTNVLVGKDTSPPFRSSSASVPSFDDKDSSQKPNVSHEPKPKPVNVNALPYPFVPGGQTWSTLGSQTPTLNGIGGVGPSPTWSTLGSQTPTLNGIRNGIEWPFSGTPFGNNPAANVPMFGTQDVHSRWNHNNRDGSGITFHRGVRCDGCGVHPITGPRFKSKVKDDYDLCSICFSQFGTESDYVRIDRPLTYKCPYTLKGVYDFSQRMHHPQQQHVYRGGGMKQSRPKLDSRFIQDVNVLDGTLVAPSTPFTKIWRMRNNGSVVWPQGTHLVWIGGDKLSDLFSVELEISANGFPVDQELDVAVDFTAPDRPGRYISYWRMSSPSGQKFGQRVWVLIQVHPSTKALPNEAARGFNLNIPPIGDQLDPVTLDVNAQPLVQEGLVEPILNVAPQKGEEVNFPINDTLLVGGGTSNDVAVSQPHISYPIVDGASFFPSTAEASTPKPVTATSAAPPLMEASLPTATMTSAPHPVSSAFSAPPFPDVSETSPVAAPSGPSPPLLVDPAVLAVGSTVQPSAENVGDGLEESLLKELERMGFMQADLNREVLRSNKYDLDKSLNDLCGVSDWDPILEELHEMGFHDDAVNKELLKKNNGSVTQVVLDLLVDEE